MRRRVLDRPMFALMRDGTVQPVQYAQAGFFISQAAKYGLPIISKGKQLIPAAGRALEKIKSGLPAIIGGGKKVKETGRALVPYVAKKAKDTKSSIWKALGWGTAAGLAPYAAHQMFDDKVEIPPKEKEGKFGSGIEEEGGPKGKYEHKKKEKAEEIEIKEKIKSGSLDEMITERMDLFNKYLGDSKDQVKAGGWAALTEFGLNLASARGGNTMDKIARSAKDPLKTFTSIGAEAAKRADKIKMAAVESGVRAKEAALGREAEMDIAELQQMPDFVKTLEYFETIPELAALSPEIKARLAKTKAVQSDEEFIREISVELIKQGEDPKDVGTIAQQIFESISGGIITITEEQIKEQSPGSTFKIEGQGDDLFKFDGEKLIRL